MPALEIPTRFRAYQLGQAGSSFSYSTSKEFTLIEARLTDVSRPCVQEELEWSGLEVIDCLHITSWDADHCALRDLEEILELYRPKKIEFPGYSPKTDCGKNCKKAISRYKSAKANANRTVECISIDPTYISGLNSAEELGYRNVFYGPKIIAENSNDNSVVKVFRAGCFNVASLGDVEDANVGSRLRRCGIFKREIDVLILAHHGANCPTNSKSFFEKVRPRVAICSSNYDNQFEHPRQEVRNALYELDIPVYTTKTGDVIVELLSPHKDKFRVHNLISDSTKISSCRDFLIKKSPLLSMNLDTIRNIYRPKPSYGR